MKHLAQDFAGAFCLALAFYVLLLLAGALTATPVNASTKTRIDDIAPPCELLRANPEYDWHLWARLECAIKDEKARQRPPDGSETKDKHGERLK